MKHSAPSIMLFPNAINFKKAFFSFSPCNILFIPYQLTKFEAPSYKRFQDILNTQKKGMSLKKSSPIKVPLRVLVDPLTTGSLVLDQIHLMPATCIGFHRNVIYSVSCNQIIRETVRRRDKVRIG